MSDTLYNQNDIIVDKTRYLVQGTLYPINAIASVRAHKHDKRYERAEKIKNWKEANAAMRNKLKGDIKNRIFLTIFTAGLLYLVMHWITVVLLLGALGWLAYAIMKLNQFEPGQEPSGPADRFSVKISTSAGETESYISYNEKEIQNIVMAISDAVSARG